MAGKTAAAIIMGGKRRASTAWSFHSMYYVKRAVASRVMYERRRRASLPS